MSWITGAANFFELWRWLINILNGPCAASIIPFVWTNDLMGLFIRNWTHSWDFSVSLLSFKL